MRARARAASERTRGDKEDRMHVAINCTKSSLLVEEMKKKTRWNVQFCVCTLEMDEIR